MLEKSAFTHVSIYTNLLEQKKAFKGLQVA